MCQENLLVFRLQSDFSCVYSIDMPIINSPTGFASVAETARRWGITRQRLYKLLHTGRIDRSDYRNWRGMIVIRADLEQPEPMASGRRSKLLGKSRQTK